MSLPELPKFTEELKAYEETTTPKKAKKFADFVKKHRTYIQLEEFFAPSANWKGVSEIIVKFNYYLSNNLSFLLPLSLTKVGTFCPCVAWQIDANNRVRYKLWESVGEILYVPLYDGSVINKNFSIEIWTTSFTAVGEIGKIYTSLSQIPTDKCNFSTDVNISGTKKRCPDTVFPQFFGFFDPRFEKYVLVDDCGTMNKVPL